MPPWPDILRQHSPIVWQTALRLLGNHPDAADCFQETFLSAMKLADRQPITNWFGLLQHLATARALDLLRKRSLARSRYSPDSDFSSLPDNSLQPLDHLQNSELADHLAQALARLPAQLAETYCLRHLNDLSYEQIAHELNISIDSVGVNLHRAKGRLRELLTHSVINPTHRGVP